MLHSIDAKLARHNLRTACEKDAFLEHLQKVLRNILPEDVTAPSQAEPGAFLETVRTPFDCVLCAGLLERCACPRAILERLHRVLKPGGIAVIIFGWFWDLGVFPQKDAEHGTEVQALRKAPQHACMYTDVCCRPGLASSKSAFCAAAGVMRPWHARGAHSRGTHGRMGSRQVYGKGHKEGCACRPVQQPSGLDALMKATMEARFDFVEEHMLAMITNRVEGSFALQLARANIWRLRPKDAAAAAEAS